MWMRLALLTGFVAFAVLFRWLPHPPNFTPILAMALFAGAHFTNRSLAFLLPLGAVALSDAFLGGFYPGFWMVYLSYVLVVALGFLQSRPEGLSGWLGLGGNLGLSAIVFFFVSNLGVWSTGLFYPMTAEGLWTSYIMGLPFFHYTLVSTLFFGYAFFGLWAYVEKTWPEVALARLEKAKSH